MRKSNGASRGDVDGCLIDLGDTAERVATTALQSKRFDCVADQRQASGAAPPRCDCSERSSTSSTLAPKARICFNTTPADTVEAGRR